MISKFENKFLVKVKNLLNKHTNIEELNEFLKNKTGIMDFFESIDEVKEFKRFLNNFDSTEEKNKELGDFQTPDHLTDKICKYLLSIKFSPDCILEPTCGEGNFVISAIKQFPSLKYVYSVEKQKKYEYLFKLNILKLSFKQDINVVIESHCDDIFTHNFSDGFRELSNNVSNFLILGNPPWITNTELSILNSDNIPFKANIKGYRGIEAMTGKGNFDIAEYIILQMIRHFSNKKGKIAMLCKTSVIKNIVRDAHKLSLKISNIQALLIDAKKEFNISADAALFVADIGTRGENACTVSSLYQKNLYYEKYGWVENKFVSNIELYKKYRHMDGDSLFEWRSGVKHDAAKVMVLRTNSNGNLLNNLKEYVDIEESLLYPYVRSSDLKKMVIKNVFNKVIITQTRTGDDTSCIASKYPKLWNYLVSHAEYLDKRKSVIYKKRPRFSIFGIGSYAFKPYKIAISGLYKTPNFSFLFPINNKTIMPDDTCYSVSFDTFNESFFTWILLNMEDTKNFLSSIVFLDSKRPYTKEILMRIDINKLVEKISFDKLFDFYQKNLKIQLEHDFNEKDFLDFQDYLKDREKYEKIQETC